jgi:hypothetical protein
MPYVFSRQLSPSERAEENEAILSRGNNKSAEEQPDIIAKLLAKDVKHGFVMVLPVETARKIKGAAFHPLGTTKQWSYDEQGNRSVKYRLTQDLTFSIAGRGTPLSASINDRINMAAYPEMIYGWCLPRIIHFIVSLRLHHPGVAIFLAKYDYSDAYRRVAHDPQAAAQTICVFQKLAFLSFRLTFGGAPNPPSWCAFSEMVVDLANEISQDSTWQPADLCSPVLPPEATVVERLDSSIAFGSTMPMALVPPTTAEGRVDGYIDDLVNVFLDTTANCARQPHVVPLAAYATMRPHAGDDAEPLPRRETFGPEKLAAEGIPREIQIVLGWLIDTHRLLISLPDHKFLAWVADIRSLVEKRRCTGEDLETTIGRLNHAAAVLPIARHFLSRIRGSLPSGGQKHYHVTLSLEAVEDFLLWIHILRRINKGISLNLLTTRQPTDIAWSDSCPYGIGGYDNSGFAWRIQFPESSRAYGNSALNNLYEFIGVAVNIWLICIQPRNNEDSRCALRLATALRRLGGSSKHHAWAVIWWPTRLTLQWLGKWRRSLLTTTVALHPNTSVVI